MEDLTNLVERSSPSVRERAEGRGIDCTRRCASRAAPLREADEEGGDAERTPRPLRRPRRFTEVDVAHPDVASRLAWLVELDLEADNIRAALRNCLADPDGADLGLTMAVGLGQYWRNRAVTEGAHWIDALLGRHGSDDAIRSEALFVKIDLAVVKGDHAAGLGRGRGGRRDRTPPERRRVAGPTRRRRRRRRLAAAWPGRQRRHSPTPSSPSSTATSFGCATSAAGASRCRRSNEIFILPVHLTSAGHGRLDAR